MARPGPNGFLSCWDLTPGPGPCLLASVVFPATHEDSLPGRERRLVGGTRWLKNQILLISIFSRTQKLHMGS